ncbi:MAG: hypothetical protein GY947_02370 [Rhodobacteraceae bacterium]|nr:hypothetical protein [Paracoccaceae bacterium]
MDFMEARQSPWIYHLFALLRVPVAVLRGICIGNWTCPSMGRCKDKKNFAPENLTVYKRMALDILRVHPEGKSIIRKMKLISRKKLL